MIDTSKIHSRLKGSFHSPPTKTPPSPNLLVLFHGQGDTLASFFNLAKSLNLPQTDFLALQGPFPIPLLEEEAWEWIPSFTMMGEPLESPDPREALSIFSTFFSTLSDFGYDPSSIHFIGYGQGGTFASQLLQTSKQRIASFVSIESPLLSLPSSSSSKNETPVLLVGKKSREKGWERWWHRAFEKIGKEYLEEDGSDLGEKMPRGRKEWEPIMRFWAKHLRRAEEERWKDDASVIEIKPGETSVESIHGAEPGLNAQRAIWDLPITATSTFSTPTVTPIKTASTSTDRPTSSSTATPVIKAKEKNPPQKVEGKGLKRGFLL
ncbi:hypothetical protein BT69DRAFT_1315902 [Atractiella rhizophila]|nr:hypothetical protein BT69DRAFT_1315902 [Atractiella rhizophila]